ncbi:MAG: hypothetical protein NVS2B6_08190 [Thermoleophilaceae bacterium]
MILPCLIGVACAFAQGAYAAPRDHRLRSIHTWAFAIGDGGLSGDLRARYAAYDLVVVDGEHASAAQVATLRRARHLVLGYLSVGTIERYRHWFRSARQYRLDLWGDWGEWYADVRAPGYRRLMLSVADGLLAKGFDGLFLDNTDMVEGHPSQRRGMAALVGGLSRKTHGRGRLLFTQNGEDSITPLLRLYDGWNREDLSFGFDFGTRRYKRKSETEVSAAQDALRRIPAAGLLVLSTDYVADGDRGAAATATRNACLAGSLPFLSDIGLRRIPAEPARCGA